MPVLRKKNAGGNKKIKQWSEGVPTFAAEERPNTRNTLQHTAFDLPRKPDNVLLVLLAVREARGELSLAHRVPDLQLRLVVDVLRPDRSTVRLRLRRQRGPHPSTANPVRVLHQLVHAVEGVQHVVQDAAREKHVVDALLALVRHGELQDPKATLQDAEEALHVLAYALQPLRKEQVVLAQRVLRGLDQDLPLEKRDREREGEDGFGATLLEAVRAIEVLIAVSDISIP